MHSRYEDHFLHPRGQGGLAAPTHRATVADAACGDELTLELAVRDGRVAEACFRVLGCSGSVAAASALVTLLPGRAAAEEAVDRDALTAELGAVPSGKQHALGLALRAWHAALQANSSRT
ncbi:MAG: iron-sulfur cluster assembly scaffold protein [Planctomycetota bacterium]|nr:iron-sulfur cluster assembly scaffold protein [Planctomycetota bacterium]